MQSSYLRRIHIEIDRMSNGFNSRLDIDRYLIEQGFNPAEIDAAWRERYEEQIQSEKPPTFGQKLLGVLQRVVTRRNIVVAALLIGAWVLFFNPFNSKKYAKLDVPDEKARLNYVAFSPNGKLLSAVDQFGQIFIWQMPERKLINTYYAKTAGYYTNYSKLFWSDDSQLIMSASGYDIQVWRLEDGSRIYSTKSNAGTVQAALSPDGSLIAMQDTPTNRAFEISLTEIGTGKISKRISLRWNTDKQIQDLKFTPDGKFLVAHNLRTIWFYNLENGEEFLLETTKSSYDTIEDFAFSPDGKYVVASRQNGGLAVWDWRNRDMLSNSSYYSRSAPTEPTFSPDGAYIALLGRTYARGSATDNWIQLYSFKNYRIVGQSESVRDGAINKINFSPDGQTVVAVVNGSVYLWNIRDLVKPDKK
jgi:dipeptidyl aminopeptidase/acylaminoacyl peptidase